MMSAVQRSGCPFVALGLAAMGVLACGPDADGTVAGGEPCEKRGQCGNGWVCFENVCRKVCNRQQECAKIEACETGVCLPVVDYECDEDSDCRAPATCESPTGAECVAGQCLYEPLGQGLDCNDHDPCTNNDRCDGAGACSGEVVVCDTPPADFCSPESVFREFVSPGVCNRARGACEYEYDDTPCDDCRHACLHLPSAPADLAASAGDTQVTLTWQEADDVMSYNVYVSETAGDAANAVPVSVASSPYVQTSLINGVAYYFAVGSVVEAGEGDLADEVSATPRISAPAQVSTLGSGRQVVLTWEPVAGAETYNLYWSYQPGVSLDSNRVSAVTSPFRHAPLLDSTPYHYALTAMDPLSESDLSGEVSAATIDPGTKLVAFEPQPGDWFGFSVALSGDYAIVGAPGEDGGDGDPLVDAGAAYVFRYDGSSWGTGTKLVAPGADARNGLGESVALSGDCAVASGSGGVYVFRRTDLNAWEAETTLTVPATEAVVDFGESVAVSGDFAIVGDSWEYGGYDEFDGPGAAYVFHYDGSSWDTGTKLVAPDRQAADRFGEAVAISGDYAIAGASEEDGGKDDLCYAAGAAYVFHYDVSSWDTGTKLVAPDRQEDDELGAAVAISGDLAIVGAPDEDGDEGDPETDTGAVYVFRRTGPNSWDTVTKLVAPDPQEDDHFGGSVALGNDWAIVGASRNAGGAAYLFRRTGPDSWNVTAKLVAPDPQEDDFFGNAVALSSEHVMVGARFEDGAETDPGSNVGAVYAFGY